MPILLAGVDRVRVVVFTIGIGVPGSGGKGVTATLGSVFKAFKLDGEVRVRDMLHGESMWAQ